MSRESKTCLFIVDDDSVYLNSLEMEFTGSGNNFIVETYPTGEQCIENIGRNPDIVILDYLLNGINPNAMNGIRTLNRIKAINPGIHVVMLSAVDKLPVAVICMQNGAYDYVVKSETAIMRLQRIITNVLRIRKMETELNWYMERM